MQGEWIDRQAGALSQRGLGQEIKAATDTPQPGTLSSLRHTSWGQCCVGPSFSLCPMASDLYSPHRSPAHSAQSPVSSSFKIQKESGHFLPPCPTHHLMVTHHHHLSRGPTPSLLSACVASSAPSPPLCFLPTAISLSFVGLKPIDDFFSYSE